MNRNLFCITAVFFGGSFLWLPGAGRCAAHSNGGVAVGARFSDPGEDAQSAGLRFITGTVLDPSGAAIPAAQVMLLSGDGKELARVSSGEDGGFQFEKLAAGTYKIQARAPGFRDTAVELKAITPQQKSRMIAEGASHSIPTFPTEKRSSVASW